MAGQIVDKKLDELASQLSSKKIELIVEKDARSLLQQKGVSQEFGAREIGRIIRNENLLCLHLTVTSLSQLKRKAGHNNGCFQT